jgi:intein/homing endonuclease
MQKYNGELETIDTEEKAYFLGFAYGDGYNGYIKKYKFSIGTSIDDYSVMKKLTDHFKFLKLTTFKSKPNLIYVCNYQKRFVLDLKNLGMTQNKLKHDKINDFNIPKQVPKELLHHFVRGFFDADGSVYFPKARFRSRNNLRVEITLATYNFIVQLEQILKDNSLDFKFYSTHKGAGNGKSYLAYTLLSSSRELSLRFRDYIYKDATIFLERKKVIFDQYIFSEKQLKKNYYPPCKFCGEKCKSIGIRDKKIQRLRCESCQKRFSVKLPLNQVTD